MSVCVCASILVAAAALQRKLPAGQLYVGMHVRTMASDLRPLANWSAALRENPADTAQTLRLLAWDTGVNVSEYVGALKALCARGGKRSEQSAPQPERWALRAAR